MVRGSFERLLAKGCPVPSVIAQVLPMINPANQPGEIKP